MFISVSGVHCTCVIDTLIIFLSPFQKFRRFHSYFTFYFTNPVFLGAPLCAPRQIHTTNYQCFKIMTLEVTPTHYSANQMKFPFSTESNGRLTTGFAVLNVTSRNLLIKTQVQHSILTSKRLRKQNRGWKRPTFVCVRRGDPNAEARKEKQETHTRQANFSTCGPWLQQLVALFDTFDLSLL